MTHSLERSISQFTVGVAVAISALAVVFGVKELPAVRRFLRMKRM